MEIVLIDDVTLNAGDQLTHLSNDPRRIVHWV